MSKKSIEDYNAGRHFRCGHCDRTCTDEYQTGCYDASDIILGRLDPSKVQLKQYYCSETCMHTIYKKVNLKSCAQSIECLSLNYTHLKNSYGRNVTSFPSEKHAGMLSLLILIKHAKIFYEKLIQKQKCEYELHEMRCKVNVFAGVALEHYHKSQTGMDYILKIQYEMEELELSVLCN
jgi:hypothetical protein